MAESLFSNSWYQVEKLKPRLHRQTQIHRHIYRDQDWYILQDHSSGRYHRFSPEAYLVIGLMDGQRTMGQIWDIACARLGDDMPTQEEVIGLLSQLHRADALRADIPPDIADMQQRHQRERRRRLLGYVRSPVSLRLPLLDPDRFLERTQALVRPLLGWVGLVLWTVAVGWALLLVGIHWKELTANVVDQVLSAENLVLLGLIYPLVKVLHELGHAYIVKRWGGEVHEMGLMFLVFFPVPYVDASASIAFRARHQRMLVSAAGILVELFIAALAMFVWVSVEPGAVRALAFNALLIAGVSTLLFNGNPLLRYDGYYILADYLEIPNMGSRSNNFIGYLAQRYILGIKEAQSPATATGEGWWLGLYAIAAFVYRLFIMVAIGLFVASKFMGAGIVLALWSLIGMLGLPLVNMFKKVSRDGHLQRKRKRIVLSIAGVLAVVAAALLAVPVPLMTLVEGVIWAPQHSRVFAQVDGVVQKVLIAPGERVEPEMALIQCDNPELRAEVKVLEAQLDEFEARYRASVPADRTESELIKDEIERIEAELARMQERVAELLIRSPATGTFLLPEAGNLPGHFVRGGTPLGYVADFSRVTVRVVVPQSEVDLVRHQTRRVEARMAESLGQIVPALILREVPAASKELPSLALSLEGGGTIALDPRQQQEPQAFETLFQFEVVLSSGAVDRIGERVYVRFEHVPEPLAYRWFRVVRRLLLRQFEV